MDIRESLATLGRRKLIIILTAVITIAVVVVVTFVIKPTYVATVTVRVATSAIALSNSSDYITTSQLLNTYAEIATSDPILSVLIKQLNVTRTPKIEVKTIPETELIQISVEDQNPQLAKDAANLLAQILSAQIGEFYTGTGRSQTEILRENLDKAQSELEQTQKDYQDTIARDPSDKDSIGAVGRILVIKQQAYASLSQQYEQIRLREAIWGKIVSIVEPATLPLTPSKPNRVLYISIAAVVGLILGLFLAFLAESLDIALYSTEQIKSVSEYNTLGRIPIIKNNAKTFNANVPFSESFYQLSTKILKIINDKQLHSIIITSPEQKEGKSTVVSNLAFSLAQLGKRIVVVDCDMRIPGIHSFFNVPNKIGLSNILEKTNSLEEAIQGSRFISLHLITSGPKPQSSIELLASPRMQELIKTLSKQYDIVLLDAPALLPVADTGMIASLADGLLLVIKHGQTTKTALQAASEQLEDMKARILGLVINGDRSHYRY